MDYALLTLQRPSASFFKIDIIRLLGCPCIFSTGNLENDIDQDGIKPGEITPSWEAIIYEESPWRIVILQGLLGF